MMHKIERDRLSYHLWIDHLLHALATIPLVAVMFPNGNELSACIIVVAQLFIIHPIHAIGSYLVT